MHHPYHFCRILLSHFYMFSKSIKKNSSELDLETYFSTVKLVTCMEFYERRILLNVSNTLQMIILTNIAVIFRPCISTYLFQCIPP